MFFKYEKNVKYVFSNTALLLLLLLPYTQRTSTLTKSGGAIAVKEPGHFEVRKSSSKITRMQFFSKKVDDFF